MRSPEMEHLDEGTAHAWLDGALDADAAGRVAAHVAACAPCAAVVAEARGLIAGASRVLSALDTVPGGVVPGGATPAAAPAAAPRAVPNGEPDAPARVADGDAPPRVVPIDRATAARRPRALPWGIRAAAGVLLAAGVGSVAWWRTGGSPDDAARREVARAEAGSGAPADAPVASTSSPLATPTPAAPTAVSDAAPSVAASADARGAARPDVMRAPRAAASAAPTRARPAEDVATARAARAAQARGNEARADEARAKAAFAEAETRTLAFAPPPPPPLPAPAAAPSAEPHDEGARGAPGGVVAPAGSGALRGVVRSAAGAPLGGVQVVVAQGARTQVAVTDATGRFLVGDLAPGEAEVRTRGIGFRPTRLALRVAAADTGSVTLALDPSALALSAVTVGGTGAEGTEAPARRRTRAVGAPASLAPYVGCWRAAAAPGAPVGAGAVPHHAIVAADGTARLPGLGDPSAVPVDVQEAGAPVPGRPGPRLVLRATPDAATGPRAAWLVPADGPVVPLTLTRASDCPR